MNRYVIFISIVAALGGLLFGFDTAVISGTLNFIQPYFGLSESGLGLTVSSLLFGCLIGVSVASKTGDLWGRKKVLMGAALVFFLSAIISSAATSLTVFVSARVLGGVGVGITSVLSPMYIAEVAPAKFRGRLVSLNQLAITSGILIAFFTNYLLVDTGPDNWRWMLLVMALPALLLFLLLFKVPESPRWLASKKRISETEDILKKIVGEEAAISELAGIENSLKNAENSISLKELFSSKKIRTLLWIGITLAIFQQITGINAIMYYAPKIFAQIGLTDSSALLQTISIGGVNLVFTLVGMSLIDRIGRKKLLIIGSLGMTVMLFCLSAVYFLDKTDGWGVLIFILGYIAFFAATLGPVLWVVVSEIFPNRYRNKAMSVSIISLWLAAILVATFFPVILTALNGAITFFIFMIICLLCLAFVIRFVPETKGKTLEEIEIDLAE